MRAIMVMYDSLNRHMLPPYGCDWVKAPNFKRLAEKTVVFDKCYVGSMPCMPARRELHTGRYNFLHRSWGPLEPFDDSMPQILRKNKIYTHLVSDHQHYWEDGGCTYHHRYNSWEIVRGQEGDRWKGEVADPEPVEHLGQRLRQDAINRKYMQKEEDQPQSVTFSLGLEFIEKNVDCDNWFIQIETFDPHEPFFTQQHYKDLYPHDYKGPPFDWPRYSPVSEEERPYIEHVRYENAALISMCDHNLGKVLDMMDKHDMWKDTMLIVNTDHGFLLGEHDWWAKCRMPFYEEIAHTPLFVWDPRTGIKAERRNALVQTIDIAPTLLDFFNVDIPKDMQGKPLKEVIECDRKIRDGALFGIHGGHVNCTDGRYVYMRAPKSDDNTPLYEYTLMPTHMRNMFSISELQDIEVAGPFSFTKGCKVMKIAGRDKKENHSYPTLLFDLDSDPGQQNPITDSKVERRMTELMIKLMKENDCPSEQFERLGLK
ncbi:MAG: Arylsulfatase [Firmicutes bacterium ADurb.Bin193]|nr:MAG: Arylsulfatase [Firmicutes bacterium ADurb.Bin193]